jgi:hypothetical protein
MKVVKKYSHLNGEEYLLVHKKNLYKEILQAIAEVDATKFKTKVSEEKRRTGELLYNPDELNREFKKVFGKLKWESVSRTYYVSDKYEVVKVIEPLSHKEQKKYLESIGEPLIRSYNQTDYVKDKIAVEVQMGKYFAVTYDLFVKHLSFYTGGLIDVGVEILPSMAMHQSMSSGPPFFEKEVHNVLRHGRTTPPVPLIVLAIEP